jgi:hypothetical protein
MKEEKPWSIMTEDEWKVERKRIQKIQARHFSGFGENAQKTFE